MVVHRSSNALEFRQHGVHQWRVKGMGYHQWLGRHPLCAELQRHSPDGFAFS
jgi:hypothetical protein